jgi:hypothetical protein
MKKTLTLFFALALSAFTLNAFAQTTCCSAMAGRNRTICCPPASVQLNGMGTCNCTDTLPDSTILHCNMIRYRWAPAASLNNPNIAQPMASPSVTTTYTLTTYCVDTTANDTCCQASSTVTVFVNSSCCRQGGVEQTNASGILMYPNPASKSVNLQLPASVSAGEVVIHDNLGRVVLTQALNARDGVAAVDISTLAEGNYVLHVRSGDVLIFSEVLLVE